MSKTGDRINDESLVWSSIEMGATLYEGGFVLYADAEWQCLETHQKDADRRPHDDGLFWIRVPPKWRSHNSPPAI